jgi:hypothetical protein
LVRTPIQPAQLWTGNSVRLHQLPLASPPDSVHRYKQSMKILAVLFVSVVTLLLGGCADQPLMSDEEYNARRGPAPNSPDYSGVLPAPVTARQSGGY